MPTLLLKNTTSLKNRYSDSMKILHLISQHPEQTGSGFYVQNIIQHSLAHGHKNHLIAGISGDTRPDLPFLQPRDCTFIPFEKGDLNFTIPGMSDVMPYPSSTFSSLTEQQLNSYSKTFKKTINEVAGTFSPDIIHSHHLWLASTAARRACPDLPMVTSCHSTDIRQYIQNDHLRSRIDNICAIDRILALSKSQQNQIAQVHGVDHDKIIVVGGGYDSERFFASTQPAAPPVQFVYAGKLSAAKGVPQLLQAMGSLRDPRIHLHLVGSGTGKENDHCLQLAQQLPDHVTIHGSIHQEQLAELMRKAHVFVLPSFFEGLPLVLLEALSSGCRIICSDLPGCKELLDSGGADIVEFIELPEMLDVDQPDPNHVDAFVTRIVRSVSSRGKNSKIDIIANIASTCRIHDTNGMKSTQLM